MKNKFLNNISTPKGIWILLAVIILCGLVLRLYNLNWDEEYSFHPDERMIALVASEIKWDGNIFNFLTPQSTWNPNFFAYGSFPIYLLKIANEIYVSLTGQLSDFDRMINIGRFFSALFDTGVIVVIYFLVKTLSFRKYNLTRWGLYSAFCYALFVLPIQLSHYYAVDTVLNFLILLTVFFAIKSVKEKKNTFLVLSYISFAFATATKITALVLVPIIFFVSIYLLFKKGILKQCSVIVFSILLYFVVLFLLMPYLFIDWREFLQQIKYQSQLFNDPYALPYTLQYVDTVKYLYFIKNIAYWGIGVWFFACAIGGLILFGISILKNKISFKQNYLFLLIGATYLIYFVYFGYSSVKFMRYMLPVYPILALFCGFFFLRLTTLGKRYFRRVLTIKIIVLSFLYPLTFVNTYSSASTRLLASGWMNQNAPYGSTVAVEHWDDRIPVDNKKNFKFLELTLYDQPDDNLKWERINKLLSQAEYIIIASNRLFTPIQKLSNCSSHKACYPLANRYYEDLFEERLGFSKVAEFKNRPSVPLFNIPLDDTSADESFSVYERPEIMIFRKK